MVEGWKQVLEDMRQALLGSAPLPKAEPPADAALPEIEGAGAPEQMAEASAPTDELSLTDEPLVEVLVEATFQSVVPEESRVGLSNKEPAKPSLADELMVGVVAGEAVESIPPDELTTELFDEETAELAPTPELMAPRPWRRWALSLIIGLAVLVAGWFLGGNRLWAQWMAPNPPAPDVIATFDSGQITIADVEAHLNQLMSEEYAEIVHSPETILLVINDMVLDELVKRWALQRQPDTDETFRHTMQHINEELDLQSFEAQLHEGQIGVTESEIQAYYNANQEQFGDLTLEAVREQIRQTLVVEREEGFVTDYLEQLEANASVTRNFDLLAVPEPIEDDLRLYYEENRAQFTLPRQVLIDEVQVLIGADETAARQAADDALLQLRSGASFEALPLEVAGVTVVTGTLVAEGIRDAAWETTVFVLTEGELSGVFRAGDAFYIVRLQERLESRVQTFEEVRSQIVTAVAPQKQDEWFSANANKTLVTIKGQQYTVGQFYQEYQELSLTLQAQFAGPDGMKELADRLIERLLIVEDANDQLLNLESQPLADEARLQVLKQMLHQEEVDDQIEITDEELQAFYQENLELMALPPQARIRYIRIGLGNSEEEAEIARQRADEAYEKLVPGLFQTGEGFATMAQEYSEDPDTAVNGGELPDLIGESGDILAEMQLHPFHEMVLTLLPNDISQPFEFGGSIYIVQLIEQVESPPLTFEDARPFIEEILRQQKHEELELQLQERLLEEANFVIYWDVLEAYFQQLQQQPTPVSLFFDLSVVTAVKQQKSGRVV